MAIYDENGTGSGSGSIIKPIELKNIGWLQKMPTHIECPACEMEGMTLVRLEAVTCWQKFLKITNLW